jgi:putative membrane protein
MAETSTNDTPTTTPKSDEDPRVRFAAERTLLAWIRTGLALMGFGFVVARFGIFLRELAGAGNGAGGRYPGLSLAIGTALVMLGVSVNLLAALQHHRIVQRLNRRQSYLAPRWSLGIIASVVLSILGLVIVGYLLMLAH